MSNEQDENFDKLTTEIQQLIDRDTKRVSDAAWDKFMETLPRRAPIEADIIPALPGIKRDYYKHYQEDYRYVVSYVLVHYQTVSEQLQLVDQLYEIELARELCCIEYEPDLLEVLQHMIPDPNLRAFDLKVRYAKRTFADAMTKGVLTGKSPFRRIGAKLRERSIRNYVIAVDDRYAALEPRTQLMRQRAYEDTMRMAAFALGEDGSDYESLPVDVRSKFACPPHILDRFREEQETGL